ncbi:PepSY domain-containing protein [Nonomuraea bangladeshensis]|uniref:PepSY domain-containing protein n=1 Tax=Nonomuraea bangladeshensis TaxID=404385 RepID=UPI003C2B5198
MGSALAGFTAPSEPPGGTGAGERASAAAMDAVKNSKVLSVQSNNEGRVWEVQLAGPDGTERLLEVDASGKVSGARVKDTGEGEKARVMGLSKDARLSFKDAAAKVSSAVPEGRITHMSLDRYGDEALVWDADVLTSEGAWHGVKVDARTGNVTRIG